MSLGMFNHILKRLNDKIQKSDTDFRKSIENMLEK